MSAKDRSLMLFLKAVLAIKSFDETDFILRTKKVNVKILGNLKIKSKDFAFALL